MSNLLHRPHYASHHIVDPQSNNNVSSEAEEKHILADRYKTKMCKNYLETGSCPYEVRCMFAHGEEELRTAEQNLADGLDTEEAIKAFQRAVYGGGKKKKSKKNNKKRRTLEILPSNGMPQEDAGLVNQQPLLMYTHDPYNAFVMAEEDYVYSQQDFLENNYDNYGYDENNNYEMEEVASPVYFPNADLPVPTGEVESVAVNKSVPSLLSAPTNRSTILLP
ncbi:Zinc finger protein CTH1 [Angomonas deanei]|uniref:Zinc finger C-x8-C-x5-C-x3-H type (And similar), putative n=1 Tax=Angomonas deanei TaxID=59799 RepID=A0A7G2C611_9TRYP|nr:Zinc finger protein CTH1 [Angomonas deanei]CAD2214581.1 Zinc finger C-x8-C-x5-C-x3-H type (and similar), putative [Angomonas deanei]|eukprot:EPY20266.1 Zinc finger protein CTH1 [Angomonas deanei]